MNIRNNLDYVLNYIDKNAFEAFNTAHFNKIVTYASKRENKEIIGEISANAESKDFYRRIFDKLINDGYIKDINPKLGGEFKTTIEGKMFLEGSKWPYKEMPYNYESYKAKLQMTWNIGKVFVIVLNALALLVFSYLQAVHG